MCLIVHIIASIICHFVISVAADNQVTLPDVTNSSNNWFGWSEENSLNDSYWIVCDGKDIILSRYTLIEYSCDFIDVIYLNTTCSSCLSGDGALDQSQYYALLSPPYMMLADNCNITISYTLLVEITIEVILRFSIDNNVTIANLSGTINDRQTATLPVSKNISEPTVQLMLRVTSNLNDTDELLSIDNVNFSDCSIAVSLTPSVGSSLAIMIESSTVDLSQTSFINYTTTFASVTTPSPSMSPQVPSSSSVMIVSSSASVLTMSLLLFSTSMTTNMVPANTSTSLEPTVLPTASLSTLIDNTMDIVSVTSSKLDSTSLPVNMNMTGKPTMLTQLISSSIRSLDNSVVISPSSQLIISKLIRNCIH